MRVIASFTPQEACLFHARLCASNMTRNEAAIRIFVALASISSMRSDAENLFAIKSQLGAFVNLFTLFM